MAKPNDGNGTENSGAVLVLSNVGYEMYLVVTRARIVSFNKCTTESHHRSVRSNGVNEFIWLEDHFS